MEFHFSSIYRANGIYLYLYISMVNGHCHESIVKVPFFIFTIMIIEMCVNEAFNNTSILERPCINTYIYIYTYIYIHVYILYVNTS